MAFLDELKTFRKKDYSSGGAGGEDKSKEGMDSGEPNSTPRIIKLSEDEQKAFAQAKPGEDLACEVHGSLEEDGKFRVMSVSPLGGGQDYGEDDMAKQVATRVMPTIQPSPSA